MRIEKITDNYDIQIASKNLVIMSKYIFYCILAVLFITTTSSCKKGQAGSYSSNKDMIVAAKLFNKLDADALQEKVEIAQRLGVVNQFLIFPEQVHRDGAAEVLNNSGIDLWLIAPIFYNDENAYSSANELKLTSGRSPNWAICDDGKVAHDEDWLTMVCPNDFEYLEHRIEYIKAAMRKCHFTGVSLDFMRHFVYWEETRPHTDPKTLRNACFCDVCIDDFAAKESISITGNNTVEKANFIKDRYFKQWTAYKCAKIHETVEYILAELRVEFPDLKSNIHAVPWSNEDYDGAIRSIAGQDFSLLSKRLDQISIMTYNRMLERPAQWINNITYDVVSVVNSRVPVVPTIEGATSANVTDSDFKDALINAVKPPSAGVVIWQFERLTEERIKIIERVLKVSSQQKLNKNI